MCWQVPPWGHGHPQEPKPDRSSPCKTSRSSEFILLPSAFSSHIPPEPPDFSPAINILVFLLTLNPPAMCWVVQWLRDTVDSPPCCRGTEGEEQRELHKADLVC